MLDVEFVEPAEVDKAARIFHRDGFVVMRNALTTEQLAYARSGAERVIAQQTAAIPLEDANRGYARYSFGSQLHHPEWAQLIDLQTVLPVLEAIWASGDFQLLGRRRRLLAARRQNSAPARGYRGHAPRSTGTCHHYGSAHAGYRREFPDGGFLGSQWRNAVCSRHAPYPASGARARGGTGLDETVDRVRALRRGGHT